jgi:hypothetical protein
MQAPLWCTLLIQLARDHLEFSSCICALQIRNSRTGMLEGLDKPHPDADHPWRTGKAWATSMQLQDAKLAGSSKEAAAEAARHDGKVLSTQ